MRSSEIFGLRWSDVLYGEGLLAVTAKLKGGKMRYVPMSSQLDWELQEFSAVAQRSNAAYDDDRILPPKDGAISGRQRLEGGFDDLLERAKSKASAFTIYVSRSRPGT
jgi:site-specific recombinase XerD